MRITVDLPDALVANLKQIAEKRGMTLKALMQEAVEKELKSNPGTGYRVKLPLVQAKDRTPINLTNAEIEDILMEEDGAAVLMYRRPR